MGQSAQNVLGVLCPSRIQGVGRGCNLRPRQATVEAEIGPLCAAMARQSELSGGPL
ncbi:hypothetical protein RISK_003420 [Rhodopirellula islandica]|uniref:Uncharacterized protein n=1 Tax=Rhodopirellula islandica TaxID=595434 RepID=A0A0J1BCZ5_RHOIS|nr:hypothetical protein RISK_003420 [Rhodopirellula islandica]